MIKFAERMNNMEGSAIRELLKWTQNPDVISFAGGMPAPELFPIKILEEISDEVLEKQGGVALQYSTTDGYLPLREQLALRMQKKMAVKDVKAEDILITNGSQQGLDFMGKAFLDKDDVVLVESPSYVGALNAFKAYQPHFISVPTDDNGMIPEELEKILAREKKVKFIYVIPDFQNPTGRCWPMERRERFMEIVNRYEIPVAEDDPYGELRYDGEVLPSLKSMDTKGLVVFLGSLSKILCPGFRIGWIAAENNMLQKFNIIKQAADLQASTISQLEMALLFEKYDVDSHVKELCKVYGHRRDVMLDAMDEYFPEGVKFTRPLGGLFTWVTLPENVDTGKMMKEKALPRNVAFVPGAPFFPEGNPKNGFRVNFSCMPDEKIRLGVKMLGEAIKEAIEESK